MTDSTILVMGGAHVDRRGRIAGDTAPGASNPGSWFVEAGGGAFNAARNLESANWILNSRKSADGKPLLLSNQIADEQRNLSFEREIGKIIGRLDLIANYTTERYRRAVIGYGQGLLAGPFLQFLPVR